MSTPPRITDRLANETESDAQAVDAQTPAPASLEGYNFAYLDE